MLRLDIEIPANEIPRELVWLKFRRGYVLWISIQHRTLCSLEEGHSKPRQGSTQQENTQFFLHYWY